MFFYIERNLIKCSDAHRQYKERVNKLKRLMILAGVSLLASCATSQEIKRPNGSSEYDIQCGAATGWDVCYSKANKVCPSGYQDISKEGGFNRKELHILCKK